MNAEDKLLILAEQMHLEPAEDVGPHGRAPVTEPLPCGISGRPGREAIARERVNITTVVAGGGGRTMPLLKTMQTSACERNCYYCPFRAGRGQRRVTFQPDELASVFMDVYRAGLVKGMFLSSGIVGGGIRAQDKILATAEILRKRYGFGGYLHLKVMPGAEDAQIHQAMTLADRLSVNLEGPTTERLQALAPRKVFYEELVRPLQVIERIRQTEPAQHGWNRRWPSTATQFVVGGVGETDLELLQTTERLNKQARIKRAYFSSFHPIANTPMENLPAEDPRRENRLYQASFLLRDYGFDFEALPFDVSGALPRNIDPKLAHAQQQLTHAPVEINKADRRDLLLVPGVGPKTANTILQARRKGTLRDLGDLRKLGLNVSRAAPYILLDGTRPPQQLALL